MHTPRIRLATAEDAGAVSAIYSPFVRDTAISFEWEPPTVEEMRERIEQTLPRFPWLVAEEEDGVVGYAYATSYRTRAAYQWSAEVSVYVDPRAHRRGVAAALYDALFALLALQGYHTLYGVIALPNEPSVTLHERMRFERIGIFPAAGFKHGAWHDVLWMRRALQPNDAAPNAPVPLAALARAAVDAVLGSHEGEPPTDRAGFHPEVAGFVELLARVKPSWLPRAEVYRPRGPGDETPPGSLSLRLSGEVELRLEPGEALLRRGADERRFVWKAAEREAAWEEVLAALVRGV